MDILSTSGGMNDGDRMSPLRIPRMIWQTSRTRVLTEEALGCRDLWLERSPGWAYRLMDDGEAREFVHDCYGGAVARTYDAFPLGVMRADFWRVLILHHSGGLYTDTDTDTAPLAPPGEWLLPTDRLVLAAENDMHLCNWTFAAEPGHPALGHLIELIVKRAAEGIDTGYEHFVHRHSGPGIFTDGIRQWLGRPDAAPPGLVADCSAGRLSEGVRILEATAFNGRHVKHFFASVSWPADYASWRKEREALAATLCGNAPEHNG